MSNLDTGDGPATLSVATSLETVPEQQMWVQKHKFYLMTMLNLRKEMTMTNDTNISKKQL